MRVAIIDYGSGNLRSAAKAFERAGAQTGHTISVVSDAGDLAQASHIVLPGVGAFADCMRGLQERAGMIEALEVQVRHKQKPFLGICVGMQMLFETGHEHGSHAGLGWLKGEVVKMGIGDQEAGIRKRGSGIGNKSLIPHPPSLKIPHMGWNELEIEKPQHPLLLGIDNGDHAYFVHSYHAVCLEDNILAKVQYGLPLTAIVAKDNIMGTQFHPEKSQKTGLQLIENFLRM